MVGVLMVSHGAFAKEALKSADMLVGNAEQLAAEGVFPGDTPDDLCERLMKLCDELDTGDGIVALVDIYGGTPNNSCFRLKHGGRNIRILTGLNLPMVIYAITERTEEMTQAELVEGLKSIGKDEIKEFGN